VGPEDISLLQEIVTDPQFHPWRVAQCVDEEGNDEVTTVVNWSDLNLQVASPVPLAVCAISHHGGIFLQCCCCLFFTGVSLAVLSVGDHAEAQWAGQRQAGSGGDTQM
jgi:hypothetical protein